MTVAKILHNGSSTHSSEGVSVLHHRVGVSSSVVHQMSCCDYTDQMSCSDAFFHHLYRSSDAMLWLHSVIASIIITSSEFDSTDHYHYPPFTSVLHSSVHWRSVSTGWCKHPVMNWPVSEDTELNDGKPCHSPRWWCAVTHATSPPWVLHVYDRLRATQRRFHPLFFYPLLVFIYIYIYFFFMHVS